MNRSVWVVLLLVLGLAFQGCIGGWSLEDSGVDAHLYAVFGISAEEVFAVGAGGTVVQRRDGIWTQLDSGVEEDLWGVWGTSAEHIVVVGDKCTVLEFNGEPEPPEEGEEPLPDLRQLAIDSCNPGAEIGNKLYSINGASTSFALSVGAGRLRSYSGESLVNFDNCGGHLLGITVVEEGVAFAAGEDGRICQFAGGSWSSMNVEMCPIDLVDGQCLVEERLQPILWDMWVGSSGEGAVVGSSGWVWAWPPPEEGEWVPLDTEMTGDLRAVDGREVEADDHSVETYMVGQHGSAYSLRNGKLRREVIDSNEHLYGVWVSEGGQVYAVGENGVIAHLKR